MNLLDLQRRMAEDVRRPLTADYEMQKATADGQCTEDIAASYIAPNARLSSFERLEIYNRQYWFRLVSAVSEDFPALSALLGPKRFDSVVLAYLAKNPSTSWTLRDLGAKLPAFLERHPEFTGRRHHLAVDVARLEWAYVDAFDGKQLDPLATEDVYAVGPHTQLFLQPHLQLLSLRYPVDNLVLALKKGTTASDIVSGAASQRASHGRVKIPPMRPEPVYLAIHRFEDSVYYRRLQRETSLLLSALRSGASVGDAMSQALHKTRLQGEEQAALLRESFALASELGWLCSRHVEVEDPSILVM